MFLRTLGGGILLAVLLGVIFFAPPWALPLVIGLMSSVAAHELLYATGFVRQNKRIVAYAMAAALLVPIWVYFGSGDWGVVLGVAVYTLLLFMETLSAAPDSTFDKLCIAFFGGIVIPYLLSSIMRIIVIADDPKLVGRLLLLYPLLGAWGSDVFAYLGGRAFGRHKLAPDISPKKTVEGSVAGFVMAPVILVLYTLLLDFVIIPDFRFNYGSAILLGVASAFCGQIGDLALSSVKRQAGIKDFGKLIPGHGGILDRFDSVLFTAPVVELLLAAFPIIM